MTDNIIELHRIAQCALELTKDAIQALKERETALQAQIDHTNQYIRDVQSYQDTNKGE